MISHHGFEEYCLVLRSTSEQAVAAIGDIDILYLDGCHDEAVAAQDVKLYLPKVRPGGYIWINDSLWAALQPAIDLLLESCDFVKLIDGGNCILFRKR